MTNWNTFPCKKKMWRNYTAVVIEAAVESANSGKSVMEIREMMIYANLPIFGLSTLYFTLLNLLSASFLVLPIFSKFYTAFFPIVFFLLLQIIMKKNMEMQVKLQATFRKPKNTNLDFIKSNTSVRWPTSKNFYKLIWDCIQMTNAWPWIQWLAVLEGRLTANRHYKCHMSKTQLEFLSRLIFPQTFPSQSVTTEPSICCSHQLCL